MKFDKFKNNSYDFEMKYAKLPKKQMDFIHYHDYYEVYFFSGSEMTYFIDNKTYNVNNNNMVFIDAYTYHRTVYDLADIGERFLFKFHPDMLSVLCTDSEKEKIKELFRRKVLAFTPETSEYISDIVYNRLLSTFNIKESSNAVSRIRLQFADLLLYIAGLEEEKFITVNDYRISNKEKKVTEIVNFINRGFKETITLEMLSEQFYLSKYYLCHIFKEITGTSVINFLIRKRLIESKRLMHETDISILEISKRVGFKSVDHFISLFKRHYNTTPGAYSSRRKQQEIIIEQGEGYE